MSGPESFIGSAFMLSNENQKAFNFVTIPRVIDLRDMHSLKKFCENQGSFDYILHFADKQPDPRGILVKGIDFPILCSDASVTKSIVILFRP